MPPALRRRRLRSPLALLAAWGALFLAAGCAKVTSHEDAAPIAADAADDALSEDASVDVLASSVHDAMAVDALLANQGPDICDNGLDDNGDGEVDENCSCAPGTEQTCFPGPSRLDGVGTCASGRQKCGGGEFSTWQACLGATRPAPELCDGLDNDCNGRVDDGCECKPNEKRSCFGGPAGTAQVGLCHEGQQTCQAGPGGVGSHWAECQGEVRPAVEICDGLDNDCDGTVDNGCACKADETRACYGGASTTQNVGRCKGGTQKCVTKMGNVGSEWGTCEGQVLPQDELCDGIDNDCDGVTDDGCHCTPGAVRPCYEGPPATQSVSPCSNGQQTCVLGAGGVGSDWGPCDGQTLPTVETCNDRDDNCDGVIDDGCLCRRGESRTCYDGPPTIAGVGTCKAGTQACVITAGVAAFGLCGGQVLPSPEVCNGRDDDCDGQIDGMTRACGSNVGDCRAGTETCSAGAWASCRGNLQPKPEDCNGGDENCDGMVDEGCACFDGSTAPCGPPEGNVGACRLGTKTCVAGQYAACVGSAGPTSEICNGIDDDCDGIIDNGCACPLGQTRPCYDGPPETVDVGVCHAGTQACKATAGVAAWGVCVGEVIPTPELCNGLDDDCSGKPDDDLTPEQVVVPRLQNRNADLLFAIDNSSSMTVNQANLVANFPILMDTLKTFPGGLPDLHVAVVTSDLGAGAFVVPGCATMGGDGGVFRAPAPTATCKGPTGGFIVEAGNETTKNYAGTINEAFTCIANVGTNGCGLEHQIASAAVALGFRGTVPTANVGFLRPDAFLAIAFITDEDDCSAPPDTAIFDPKSSTLTDPYGPLASYRCNEFGHRCGGAKPPRIGTTPVTLTGCTSAEDGVLYKVSELAAFFKSLKSDPAMLFVSAIAAPPSPYTVSFTANPGLGGALAPAIGHSCTRSDGAFADPAVRLSQFVSQFGTNGSFSSICNDSFAPALSQLGTAIGKALTPHCLDAKVADRDSTKAGIQASCRVLRHVPPAMTGGTSTDTDLPQCDAASTGSGPQPCWYLTANTTCSSGIQFAVNRADAPADGETISIRCNACL